MSGTTTDAGELLHRLILDRFSERYAQFPHSVQAHILACPSLTVQDLTHRDAFSCCESCPYVEIKAAVSCDHAMHEFEYEQSGRLEWILADMQRLADTEAA